MNTYALRFYLDDATPLGFVAGDAVTAQKLCAMLGHLWMSSKILQTGYTPGLSGNKYSQDVGNVECDFITPLRLPNALEVPDVPTFFTGNGAGTAALGLVVEDDNYNDRSNNLGNPIVIAGALVVALTLGGVDVTNELTTTIRIPCGNDSNGTQYLNIGYAAASAQDGVYDTPFASALTYWTGGTGTQRNAPILVTGGGIKMLGK